MRERMLSRAGAGVICSVGGSPRAAVASRTFCACGSRGMASPHLSSQAAMMRPPVSWPMFGPKFFTYGCHAATAFTDGP